MTPDASPVRDRDRGVKAVGTAQIPLKYEKEES